MPSTRQIAREHGVALATATKVLNRLRDEGLVHSRPRAGTVVAAPAEPRGPAEPPDPAQPRDPAEAGDHTAASARAPARAREPGDQPRRRGPRPSGQPDGELSRDRVVRAAIELADAEGLDALSMRGVAARLGVATMTIYRYVAGKEELVLLMADAAFGELGYPGEPRAGWRAQVERAARTLWAVHRRHPWLAQLNSLFPAAAAVQPAGPRRATARRAGEPRPGRDDQDGPPGGDLQPRPGPGRPPRTRGPGRGRHRPV
ncbi:TetR family transcriptional regulator [Nonomuraea ferruginea]